jgi:hypothetical protein
LNYIKVYIRLIRKAIDRTSIKGYLEKHHVFPTSIFGDNKFTVDLTAEEHLYAHHFLWIGLQRRYGNNNRMTRKMFFAYRQMVLMCNSPNLTRCYRNSAKTFSKIREMSSEYLMGDNNPSKNAETREKIRKSKTGVSRDDLKGKMYFGSLKSAEDIIKISIENKRVAMENNLSIKGKKIDYPKNRKSSECSEDKKNNIKNGKLKRYAEVRIMDRIGFYESVLKPMLVKGTLLTQLNNCSPNTSIYLKMRDENIHDYRLLLENEWPEIHKRLYGATITRAREGLDLFEFN